MFERRIYSPRTEPMALPSEDIEDAPGVPVCINETWVPHITGVLEVLAQPEYWLAADQQSAQAQVARLIAKLGREPGGCNVSLIPNNWHFMVDIGCFIFEGAYYSLPEYAHQTFYSQGYLGAYQVKVHGVQRDNTSLVVGGHISQVYVRAGTDTLVTVLTKDCAGSTLSYQQFTPYQECTEIVAGGDAHENVSEITVMSLDHPVCVTIPFRDNWTCGPL